MIKIIYAEDGEIVADLQAEEWAQNILVRAKHAEYNYDFKKENGTLEEVDSKDLTVRVAAELMILQLCVFLYNGTLTKDDIEFYLPNHTEPLRIVQRRNGRWGISGEPGFCDIYENTLSKMVAF